MVKYLITSLLVILSYLCSGQDFYQKIYSGNNLDQATKIISTQDGGYLLCGMTKSSGAGLNDMYVIKMDENGNKIWDKIIGGSGVDNTNSIIETLDGGFAIIGSTSSFSSSNDVYVVKLDSNGQIIWDKTYGGTDEDDGQSISQLSDSSYILSCNTKSFGAGLYDIYLMKIDKNGGLIFTKTIGGPQSDRSWGHIVTPFNEIIIAGSTMSFGAGQNDGYLIKTDISGNVIWTKSFGTASNDRFFCIDYSLDGNYFLGGASEESGGGGEDWWLSKISPSGTVLQSLTYGGNQNDQLYDLKEISDGKILMFGASNSYNPVNTGSALLIKADLTVNGAIEWAKIYGGTNYTSGRSMVVKDSNYILAGNFGANTSTSDIYLIQTTKKGFSNCLEQNVFPVLSSLSPTSINAGSINTGGTMNEISSIVSNSVIELSILCEGNCMLNMIIENDTLACYGDGNGMLTPNIISGQSPYEYFWSDEQNSIISSGENLLAGQYFIKISDANGCEIVDTAYVIEPLQLQVNLQIVNSEQDICNGSIVAIPYGGTEPYSYLWSGNVLNSTESAVDSLCNHNYCLTVTDMNNCVQDTCVEVALGFLNFDSIYEITLYPNPSSSLIKFTGEINLKNALFNINSLSGQIQLSGIVEDGIDISNLPEGMYIISVYSNKGKINLRFFKK